MYKKSAIALTFLMLAGCQGGTGGGDWIAGDGCERYFSETSYDMATCKSYRDGHNGDAETKMSANGHQSVVTSDVDATVSMTEGIKRYETSEQNITE